MPTLATDLWSLVQGRPQIDPEDLASAIEGQIVSGDLDYRTRLLIRDSMEALELYWQPWYFAEWLAKSPVRDQIESICAEKFERRGFPSIVRRLMNKTEPETILKFFAELGKPLHEDVRLRVGGSVALILTGFLSRKTEDVDVVDEVPKEIRDLHKKLDDLQAALGLHIAHFQSHYLPRGWENRLHYLDEFGRLQVSLVDVYDVFLSKLFSARSKDKEDLRMLQPQLEKEKIIQRLKDTTSAWQSEPYLLQRAQSNWQFLYGEPLPQ